jgi:hypothetical protein
MRPQVVIFVTSDNINNSRLFYTCGIEVDDVTRGDEMTKVFKNRLQYDLKSNHLPKI